MNNQSTISVVLVSVCLNHHQLPICEAFRKRADVSFSFVSTVPMAAEKIALGYEILDNKYEYVVRSYESKEEYCRAVQLCDTCDVLIVELGRASEYSRARLKKHKLTFFYSEHLFKSENSAAKNFGRYIKYFLKRNVYKGAYLLCSSAYATSDYNSIGLFRNKTFKWAYFPVITKSRFDEIYRRRFNRDTINLLWVGRLIDWKHPEMAIEVAKQLKKQKIHFHLNIIGDGILRNDMENIVSKNNLGDVVSLLGAKKASQITEYMEDADIFLFTSDHGEGWGAVLNEAMGCGCAVVASNACGSTFFLVEDHKDGVIYYNNSQQELNDGVRFLLQDDVRTRISQNAYHKIHELWTAENAVSCFVELTKSLISGGESPFLNGPCSKAERVKYTWGKNEKTNIN